MTTIPRPAVFLCFLLATVTSPFGQTLAPLPVHEALGSKSFAGRSPIDLSPDGAWLAYVLYSQSERSLINDPRYSTYSRTGVGGDAVSTSVWITKIKSGQSKRLIEGAQSWGASWSPDSRSLAFYSDKSGQAGLWIWEASTDRIRRVSREIVRTSFGYEVPQWTPDGRQVLVKLLPEGLNVERAIDLLHPSTQQSTKQQEQVMVFTSPLKTTNSSSALPRAVENRASAYFSDLAMVDVAAGSAQRFIKGRVPSAYYLSPDASQVALMESKGRENQATQQLLYDVTIVSIKDGAAKTAAQNIRMNYGATVSWSSNSRFLAYVTAGPLATGDCFVFDLQNGKTRNLTEGEHPKFGSNHYRAPLWNPSGDKLYCLASNNLWEIPLTGKPRQVNQNFAREVTGIVTGRGKGIVTTYDIGRSIVVTTRDSKTKQSGFYKIDVETGQASKLAEDNEEYGAPVFYLDVSDDGREIVYVSQDGSHCADVWMADAAFANRNRISNTNPLYDKFVLGETRLVEWTSQGGERRQGTLLLPAGYQAGKKYPVIVDVYGGSMGSNFVNRFGTESTGASFGILNTQLLATRGYGVFIPDTPTKVGSPMRDIADAVLPGVDRVVELGIADPERLGIKGVSYGGYCTLALIVQTTRFKAAIVRSSGGANLFTTYGVMSSVSGNGQNTGWAESGQGAMGGTPWQFRDRYIENSPIFYFDKVATPVMIMAGTEDSATPAFLSDEIFVALQRLGKEAVYLKYKGGEHGESSLDPEMAIDYFYRMITWFDKYLKAPETKPKTPNGL